MANETNDTWFLAAREMDSPTKLAAARGLKKAGIDVIVTLTESELDNLDAITDQAKQEGFFVQFNSVGRMNLQDEITLLSRVGSIETTYPGPANKSKG